MARQIYFYTSYSETELWAKVQAHQRTFDEKLGDLFSPSELEGHAILLDELAAVDVQPALEGISLDDFVLDEDQRGALELRLERCQSTLVFEAMPFLENNPFQVSYLLELLSELAPCLIDQGGLGELGLSENFVLELQKLRQRDQLVRVEQRISQQTQKGDPFIEALVREIYRELERLGAEISMNREWEMSEKRRQLLDAFLFGKQSPTELLGRSKLHPKDFSDNLEGLKFFLRKR